MLAGNSFSNHAVESQTTIQGNFLCPKVQWEDMQANPCSILSKSAVRKITQSIARGTSLKRTCQGQNYHQSFRWLYRSLQSKKFTWKPMQQETCHDAGTNNNPTTKKSIGSAEAIFPKYPWSQPL